MNPYDEYSTYCNSHGAICEMRVPFIPYQTYCTLSNFLNEETDEVTDNVKFSVVSSHIF